MNAVDYCLGCDLLVGVDAPKFVITDKASAAATGTSAVDIPADTRPQDEYARSVEAEFLALKAQAEKLKWPAAYAPEIVAIDSAWQSAKASANAKKTSVFREDGWDQEGAKRKRIRELTILLNDALREIAVAEAKVLEAKKDAAVAVTPAQVQAAIVKVEAAAEEVKKAQDKIQGAPPFWTQTLWAGGPERWQGALGAGALVALGLSAVAFLRSRTVSPPSAAVPAGS